MSKRLLPYQLCLSSTTIRRKTGSWRRPRGDSIDWASFPLEPIAMRFEDKLRRVWHLAARIYSMWWCRFWRDQRDAKRRSFVGKGRTGVNEACELRVHRRCGPQERRPSTWAWSRSHLGAISTAAWATKQGSPWCPGAAFLPPGFSDDHRHEEPTGRATRRRPSAQVNRNPTSRAVRRRGVIPATK
jgi:hypothetical protein